MGPCCSRNQHEVPGRATALFTPEQFPLLGRRGAAAAEPGALFTSLPWTDLGRSARGLAHTGWLGKGKALSSTAREAECPLPSGTPSDAAGNFPSRARPAAPPSRDAPSPPSSSHLRSRAGAAPRSRTSRTFGTSRTFRASGAAPARPCPAPQPAGRCSSARGTEALSPRLCPRLIPAGHHL